MKAENSHSLPSWTWSPGKSECNSVQVDTYEPGEPTMWTPGQGQEKTKWVRYPSQALRKGKRDKFLRPPPCVPFKPLADWMTPTHTGESVSSNAQLLGTPSEPGPETVSNLDTSCPCIISSPWVWLELSDFFVINSSDKVSLPRLGIKNRLSSCWFWLF